MSFWPEIIFILIAYLIGSIPIGYILVKSVTGENILQFGSGSIGSTNVKRVAGGKIAFITQILDMLKGIVPVGVYLALTYDSSLSYVQNLDSDLGLYYIAFAVILGHDFSFYLNFKGGKGVNTTLGASVLIAPIPVFTAVTVYLLAKLFIKYASLLSIILASTMVLCNFTLYGPNPTFYYLLACLLLIIIVHLKNISRLLNNSESKIS